MPDVVDAPTPGETGGTAGAHGDALARLRLVQSAVARWTGQLVDTTGRNMLLNFRHLRRGTLDLGAVQESVLARLLRGEAVRSSELSNSLEGPNANLRAIHAKARENFEERGLQTLYLTFGLATWDGGTSWTPNAPIVLVPVELTPEGASHASFTLRTRPDDAEVNPTLLHLLRTEWRVVADEGELSSTLDGSIDEPWEVRECFDWLERHARDLVTGFAIDRDAVGLANLSFAKLPMVLDLEGSTELLVDHPVVAALAGDLQARAALRANVVEVAPDQPDHVPPADEFLVLDADSSQNAVINSVLAGNHLVVQGPPGTGKSQTIANLVATLVARGKTVLFVAEKRAAIEAVTSRLERAGLSDTLLDLHGSATSRKQFFGSIGTSLDRVRSTGEPDVAALQAALAGDRDALRTTTEALHEVRAPWDVSLYQLYTRLAASDVEVRHRLAGQALVDVDGAAAASLVAVAQQVADLGGFDLERHHSPWARADVVDTAGVDAARELLVRLRGSVADARARGAAGAARAGVRVPSTPSEMRDLGEVLGLVATCLVTVRPSAFALDTEALAGAVGARGGGAASDLWWRIASPAYRRARATLLAERVSDEVALGPAGAAVRQVHAARTAWLEWRTGDAAAAVPPDLEAWRDASGAVVDDLDRMDAVLARAGSLRALAWDEVGGELDRLASQGELTTLVRLPEIRAGRARLVAAGFGPVVAELDASAQSPADGVAGAMVDACWSQSVVEELGVRDPRLSGFSAQAQGRHLRSFAEEDVRNLAAVPARVLRRWAEHVVAMQGARGEEASVVEHQARLKTRHQPVRKVVEQAADTLLAIKPCWAMSPLVVSQLLPVGRQLFDVVVFDEASQVQPPDAIPAIARGRQVVVAGDEHQLPPTSFFASQSAGDDDGGGGDDDEDGDALVIRGTDGFESLLDAMQAIAPFRRLLWHYRSRDERLIAFSNARVYDGSLVTFPGAEVAPPLRLDIVPTDPQRLAVKASTPTEVDHVVELAIDHARTRPHESLGVIAMGIEHATRIEAALRARLAGDPQLEAYFDPARDEAFFVKNLERVQGDERDAIVLSIGYGPAQETGRLALRFGPLTGEHGYRRLNVAISRARNRMVVTTSFRPSEINRGASRGVELLREFLEFAASGGSALPSDLRDATPLNAFEIDIKRRLEGIGLQLDCQHGSSGYRIDFAVRHPDRPGEYLLAVEADGASYHALPTVRDRDRLRQGHLERLGWRFHRIWSTDWFRDPDACVAAVREAYEAALRAHDAPPTVGAVAATAAVTVAVAGSADRGARPGVAAGRPIAEYRPDELLAVARWLLADGLLRTRDQLVVELMAELGFRRRGTRITAALEAAAVAALSG